MPAITDCADHNRLRYLNDAVVTYRNLVKKFRTSKEYEELVDFIWEVRWDEEDLRNKEREASWKVRMVLRCATSTT